MVYLFTQVKLFTWKKINYKIGRVTHPGTKPTFSSMTSLEPCNTAFYSVEGTWEPVGSIPVVGHFFCELNLPQGPPFHLWGSWNTATHLAPLLRAPEWWYCSHKARQLMPHFLGPSQLHRTQRPLSNSVGFSGQSVSCVSASGISPNPPCLQHYIVTCEAIAKLQ